MAVQTNGVNGVQRSAVCSVEDFLQEEYDFIVIGGGTAGLTIATRLTEIPDTKVGVLEAGKDMRGHMLVDIPALHTQLLGNPEFDWMLKTVPQKGNNGRVHHVPRGKALGGSSAINYMMYVRGSDQDYDDWAAIVGDPSWGSSAMKQYMRKHQTLEPIDEAIIDRTTMPFVGENHGTSGPVRTSFNDFQLPLDNDVINACDDVTGISKKPTDPWSGDHIGFFNTLGSVVRSGPDRGKRSYAARGYLGQSDGRPNLKILCEAQVTGITLDGNTAKGVNFTHGGTQHSINVTKEVILCGGAIHSPQILELSGIGDPKVLEAAGIPCKINLPGVGNSYQDHSLTGGCWEVAPGVQCMDAFHIPEVMAEAQKALMEKQGGPLTCIASCQGFFPYKLLVSDAELKETVQSIRETAAKASPFQKKQLEQVIAHLESSKSANLQFVLVPATPDFVEGVQDQAKLFPPPPEPGKNMGVTLVICLEYPASRGSIHVTSSDPTQPPVIDPAYADHPADIAVLAAGLKFLDSVAKSKPLEGKLVSRVFPNPDLDLQNLNDSRKAVQELILGEYHSCGSCPMGDVVDSHLRVNGVQGLRVADASVFPNHVSGNICSSVYAVAEKAADLIKDEYQHAALKKSMT